MVAFSKISSVALLASAVSAHTIFQELYVNGKDQGHLTGIRYPNYDGPIYDVTSPDIICNGGASNSGLNKLNTPYPKDIITVPSGADITMEWHHTLDSNPTNDSADPIDPGHKGPIMAYLAAVPDATQTDVTGLKWFKVYEDGYNYATDTWAVDKLVANKGKVTFTLPSCIQPGNYFLRGELIALHGASSLKGAQFYMECAQINIVGGGSASPPTVSFPGAYKQDDPGVLINIYYPKPTTYTIPGPRPYTCGAGSGGSAPKTTQAAQTTLSTTKSKKAATTTTTKSKKAATTTAAPAPATTTAASAGGAGSVGAFGQCGGSSYSGAKTCVSGYTCKVLNDYYSQCVAN